MEARSRGEKFLRRLQTKIIASYLEVANEILRSRKAKSSLVSCDRLGFDIYSVEDL